jgi:hypothetical protein
MLARGDEDAASKALRADPQIVEAIVAPVKEAEEVKLKGIEAVMSQVVPAAAGVVVDFTFSTSEGYCRS